MKDSRQQRLQEAAAMNEQLNAQILALQQQLALQKHNTATRRLFHGAEATNWPTVEKHVRSLTIKTRENSDAFGHSFCNTKDSNSASPSLLATNTANHAPLPASDANTALDLDAQIPSLDIDSQAAVNRLPEYSQLDTLRIVPWTPQEPYQSQMDDISHSIDKVWASSPATLTTATPPPPPTAASLLDVEEVITLSDLEAMDKRFHRLSQIWDQEAQERQRQSCLASPYQDDVHSIQRSYTPSLTEDPEVELLISEAAIQETELRKRQSSIGSLRDAIVDQGVGTDAVDADEDAAAFTTVKTLFERLFGSSSSSAPTPITTKPEFELPVAFSEPSTPTLPTPVNSTIDGLVDIVTQPLMKSISAALEWTEDSTQPDGINEPVRKIPENTGKETAAWAQVSNESQQNVIDTNLDEILKQDEQDVQLLTRISNPNETDRENSITEPSSGLSSSSFMESIMAALTPPLLHSTPKDHTVSPITATPPVSEPTSESTQLTTSQQSAFFITPPSAEPQLDPAFTWDFEVGQDVSFAAELRRSPGQSPEAIAGEMVIIDSQMPDFDVKTAYNLGYTDFGLERLARLGFKATDSMNQAGEFVSVDLNVAEKFPSENPELTIENPGVGKNDTASNISAVDSKEIELEARENVLTTDSPSENIAESVPVGMQVDAAKSISANDADHIVLHQSESFTESMNVALDAECFSVPKVGYESTPQAQDFTSNETLVSLETEGIVESKVDGMSLLTSEARETVAAEKANSTDPNSIENLKLKEIGDICVTMKTEIADDENPSPSSSSVVQTKRSSLSSLFSSWMISRPKEKVSDGGQTELRWNQDGMDKENLSKIIATDDEASPVVTVTVTDERKSFEIQPTVTSETPIKNTTLGVMTNFSTSKYTENFEKETEDETSAPIFESEPVVDSPLNIKAYEFISMVLESNEMTTGATQERGIAVTNNAVVSDTVEAIIAPIAPIAPKEINDVAEQQDESEANSIGESKHLKMDAQNLPQAYVADATEPVTSQKLAENRDKIVVIEDDKLIPATPTTKKIVSSLFSSWWDSEASVKASMKESAKVKESDDGQGAVSLSNISDISEPSAVADSLSDFDIIGNFVTANDATSADLRESQIEEPEKSFFDAVSKPSLVDNISAEPVLGSNELCQNIQAVAESLAELENYIQAVSTDSNEHDNNIEEITRKETEKTREVLVTDVNVNTSVTENSILRALNTAVEARATNSSINQESVKIVEGDELADIISNKVPNDKPASIEIFSTPMPSTPAVSISFAEESKSFFSVLTSSWTRAVQSTQTELSLIEYAEKAVSTDEIASAKGSAEVVTIETHDVALQYNSENVPEATDKSLEKGFSNFPEQCASAQGSHTTESTKVSEINPETLVKPHEASTLHAEPKKFETNDFGFILKQKSVSETETSMQEFKNVVQDETVSPNRTMPLTLSFLKPTREKHTDSTSSIATLGRENNRDAPIEVLLHPDPETNVEADEPNTANIHKVPNPHDLTAEIPSSLTRPPQFPHPTAPIDNTSPTLDVFDILHALLMIGFVIYVAVQSLGGVVAVVGIWVLHNFDFLWVGNLALPVSFAVVVNLLVAAPVSEAADVEPMCVK